MGSVDDEREHQPSEPTFPNHHPHHPSLNSSPAFVRDPVRAWVRRPLLTPGPSKSSTCFSHSTSFWRAIKPRWLRTLQRSPGCGLCSSASHLTSDPAHFSLSLGLSPPWVKAYVLVLQHSSHRVLNVSCLASQYSAAIASNPVSLQ